MRDAITDFVHLFKYPYARLTQNEFSTIIIELLSFVFIKAKIENFACYESVKAQCISFNTLFKKQAHELSKHVACRDLGNNTDL